MREPSEVVDGWAQGVSGSVVHPDRIVHVEHVWNTAVSIVIAGTPGREREALAAVDRCSAFFADVDRTFSTYRPDTEAAFYRNGLSWRSGHSQDFATVLDECARLTTLTDGAFDPWAVPGGFDASGYVKGWAAGRASAHLAEAGFPDHLVNAGGDICASGDEVVGSASGWPVGILNPHSPAEVIEVVHLAGEAMATSARYERGDHVIDPRAGTPATSVDSATVVGPDPGTADAVASAALVDGPESMRWFPRLGPAWSLLLVVGRELLSYGPAFE